MAQKQFMLLKKIEFDNYLIGQNGQPVKQVRVGIVKPAKVTWNKLIKNICDHTGYPRAQVRGVLSEMASCVNDYLEIGATVELEDFMTIKPLIKVKAVSDKKLATADTIKSRTIRCTAIGEFAEMAKGWGFQLQSSNVEKGEASDDDGGVDDSADGENNGNQNAGNQQGGQQTGGNQQQTPTTGKVTVKWIAFDDSVKKTMEVAPGGSIQQSDIPAATGDNTWSKNLAQINSELATATAGTVITVQEEGDSF